MKNKFVNLRTSFADDFNKDAPLQEYPRPNLRRASYLNLNGQWDYAINKTGIFPKTYEGKITVPYPLESELSGVQRKLKSNEYLFYKLEFFVDKSFRKDIDILHIDGVDQCAEIYLNGVLVGLSNNGYIPSSYDVTKFMVNGINELIVKVKDSLNKKYCYGKQKKNRGGMWYTPCSGIWKSVWYESVANTYIKNIDIKVLPTLDGILLHIDTNAKNKLISVQIEDKIIYSINTQDNDLTIKLDKPHLWSPEDPFLYDLHIETKEDDVTSYFGLRKIEIKDNKIYLNNKKYFCNGVLDQGYFPDGIYTPASYKAYAFDILSMKNLGFNTLRKHIKIEPLYFYYMCDVYGMLVFQDMVNNAPYSFIIDTALPTVIKNLHLSDKHRHKKYNDIFKEGMIKTVELLKPFPSIVLWTIYNEGWGQHNADKMHELLLSYDDTRLIDDTSGWFEQKSNMFKSLHIYFKKINIKEDIDKPIYISEFGGYSYKVKNHIFNPNHAYGYKFFNTKEDFEEGFINLYKNEIIPIKDKLSAIIYTQVSDVEDEINGLLTYDRKVLKVDENKVSEVMKKLQGGK
ncbi:MAG: glycoside hydrolase family 2 protein [Bacilli bacterium]